MPIIPGWILASSHTFGGFISCSSLDIANYFAGDSWDNITLAFTLNLRQLAGINALAHQINLGVLVESVETVRLAGEALTASVNVWIKVDAGAGRTGLLWNRPEAILTLAEAIHSVPNFKLVGLLTHSGNSYLARTPEEAASICRAGIARLSSARDELQAQDIGPLLVSIGDTPGCSTLDEFKPADEIRPGNFIFNDAQQLMIRACQWDEVAVALACPVVGLHPVRDEAIIYGGAIHLSKDYFEEDGVRKYGLVCLPAMIKSRFTSETW